jgi:hypothetical protein
LTESVALLIFCFGPLVPFHVGFSPSYESLPEEAFTYIVFPTADTVLIHRSKVKLKNNIDIKIAVLSVFKLIITISPLL